MELLLDSNRKMEVNISNIKLDMSRFSRNLVLLLVTIIWQSSLGTNAALKEGLLVIGAGADVLRFVPPLIIEKEHVDEMIAVLEKIL